MRCTARLPRDPNCDASKNRCSAVLLHNFKQLPIKHILHYFPLKKHFLFLLIIFIILTGCAPKPEASPPTLAPTEKIENPSPEVQNQPPVRYAILAPGSEENIWSLFDENGASYEGYAIYGVTYPRLYQLAPPNNKLTPLLADGFPSAFEQEGEYFVSSIKLLPNLSWDDGSPLSAEDVAFTVNTALAFELGLNWADFYNKEKLHRVEALDALTIKYYFSSPPSTGDWQHGALIGVFANQNYWQPKIEKAATLLPNPEDDLLMAEYQIQIDALQAEADIIYEHMQTLNGKSTEYRGEEQLFIDREFRRDSFKKKLELAQREKREKYLAARAALYTLDNTNEPHFSIPIKTLNTVASRASAIKSLLNSKSDFFLTANGLSPAEIAQLSADPNIHFVENRRNDIRFLIFNPELDDVALRRALACLIDPVRLANERLDEGIIPALGWIPPENIGWHSSVISPPCAGMDADTRLAEAARILQKAGYAWEQEPSPNQAGSGLRTPSGEDFPSINILAQQEASSRSVAASYIAEAATQLGVPVETKLISTDDLFFAVYGGGNYDLAIVGWSLSLYPDYLCDFFAVGNPYHYSNPAIDAKCAELTITSDMTRSRQLFFEIEVLIWDDIPAVPLYSSKVIEAYRNISLPFENYLGGFAPTLYGVPGLE
jgi:peptide/nickel transport system substrate-binding protein